MYQSRWTNETLGLVEETMLNSQLWLVSDIADVYELGENWNLHHACHTRLDSDFRERIYDV